MLLRNERREMTATGHARGQSQNSRLRERSQARKNNLCDSTYMHSQKRQIKSWLIEVKVRVVASVGVDRAEAQGHFKEVEVFHMLI